MSCPFLKGLLSGGCTTGNDGYLVFLYEQTLVFEMRNQTALQRVANLLQWIEQLIHHICRVMHLYGANDYVLSSWDKESLI